MAEGWLRALSAPGVQAGSAGRIPGPMRPEVAPVMGEVGIDLSSQRSKPLEGLEPPDVVLELGDEPAPVPWESRREVWSTPDPCTAPTTANPLAPFRIARDADRVAGPARGWPRKARRGSARPCGTSSR